MNEKQAQNIVITGVNPNEGYSPDQVRTTLTLGELLEQVQYAIQDYGEDAVIVTDNGQRYGAQWGSLSGEFRETREDWE